MVERSMKYWRNISSWFSSNSEANASELLENHDEMSLMCWSWINDFTKSDIVIPPPNIYISIHELKTKNCQWHCTSNERPFAIWKNAYPM